MPRSVHQDVTGTQHAPVESQIETVASVSAQLAPGRHTELSWHQADTQTAMQQTERPLRESLLISSEICSQHASLSCSRCKILSIGNCTQRRNGTSSEHSTLTLGVR